MIKLYKKRFTVLLAGVFLLITLPAFAVQKLSIMLDWFPNVDHLPIYVAQGKGYFSEEDLEVTILSPSATTDALKLAASNNVDLAISYEPQVIMGASQELPVKVVGRLVGQPLSVLLFLKGSGIESPSDLEGKIIGYTVPGMMDILMDAFAKINGIVDFKPINVGFTIVQSLAAGKVDAIMGPYKNYETVELEEKGFKAGYFDLADWGIPVYDELVFIAAPDVLQKKSNAVKGFVRAINKAVVQTKAHPESSLDLYFKAVPEAPREMETKAFWKTLPFYAVTQHLDMEQWQQFADFAYKYGLIQKAVNVQTVIYNIDY